MNAHRFSNLLLAAAAAAALSHAAATGTARAAESPNPTRHATAYNLDWLNFIDPQDLPPSRYATCIVDTGLAVTPDAPPDSPTGPILERLAVDDGSGEPQGTQPEHLHGTYMAHAAVAPVNDWGTVGTAVWGRVISVRASVSGETGFRPDAYRRGLAKCQNAHSRHPIAATSLSFSCGCDMDEEEELKLHDAVSGLHGFGITVVAAAGNTAGAGTAEPARFPGVFAVGAGSDAGTLCSYSSFDDRVDVLGPACPVDTADPLTGEPDFHESGGSSVATVGTSVLITGLRTLRPDATHRDVENWIRDASRIVNGRRVLDGEATARAAGLGAVIERAQARMSQSQQTSTSSVTTTPPADAAGLEERNRTEPARLARLLPPERIRARWHRGQLVVRPLDLPPRATFEIRAVYLRGLQVVRQLRRSSHRRKLRWRLRHRPDGIRITYRPAAGDSSARRSPVAYLYRSGGGWYR